MTRLLAFGLIVIVSQARLAAADEAEQVKQVRDHLTKNNVDAAEESHRAALKEFPDSTQLKSLHYSLFSAQYRAEKFSAAADHAGAFLDYQLELAGKNPASVKFLPTYVSNAAMAYDKAGKSDVSRERFDRTIARIEALIKDKSSPELLTALADLRGGKILWLGRSGKTAEAEKLLAAELTAARKAFDADSANPATVLRLGGALKVQNQLVDDSDAEQEAATRDEYLAFLTEQAKKHTENAPVVSAYLDGHLAVSGSIAYTEPAAAEKLLQGVQDFVKSLDPPAGALKTRLKSLDIQVKSVERAIETGKTHVSLIGTASLPLGAEAWANGKPLSDDDLKGKVVLLDFWAVWNDPCIDTFPHLREWREKYSEKGFVIVGMTRYYSYDWDSDAKKIKNVKDLDPELERAAMEKFAGHHKLKHPFAITPKTSELPKTYAATAMPTVLLIDRAGKIRFIRVGSGPKNARDLEETIKKLLNEPAPAAKSAAR